MIRAVIAAAALLFTGYAAAADMQPPRTAVADVDWPMATASVGGADALDALNAAATPRFSGIANSSVPVLLPFNKEVLAGFQPTAFFNAGPGGYDTVFSLRPASVGEFSDIRYAEPVYVMMSGMRVTYELDGRALPEGQPAKDLDAVFPGIRRTLHESYVRYSFTRFGVNYVAAIFCRDTRPRARILTCRQADRIADRFLRALKVSGGSASAPGPVTAHAPIARPENPSPDFTYFSPGALIPGSGRKPELPGRADYTVYAPLRFPLKEAPAFANSQSFNNWGDCDFTGRTPRRLGKKGMAYSCKVNGRGLVFDESAGANYSYPWRDNFCEHRNFFVGQCPGGQGHQGQDIRPSDCALRNQGADRCEPYRHTVVAGHDGMILRAPKQEAVFLFINTADTYVRLRYMHMNPKLLDADNILSGVTVRAGERLGLVGNYNEYERGTTYHLHFDLQVPTPIGWVFVNPYMSLVAAYEQLIGARGTEIRDGDPMPASASVPPIILNPPVGPAAAATPAEATAPTAPGAASAPKDAHAAEPAKMVAPKPFGALPHIAGPEKTGPEKAKPRKETPRKKIKRNRRKPQQRSADDSVEPAPYGGI